MAKKNVKGTVRETGYRVDAGLVAEAMLRHPGIHRLLGTAQFRPAGGARSPGSPAPRPRSA
jgi:hypothetical protein